MEKQSFELIKEVSKKHKVHKITYNASEENRFQFFYRLKKRVRQTLELNPGIEIIHLNDGAMGVFASWLQKEVNIPVTVTFHGLDVVHPNKLYQQKAIKSLKKYDGFICVSDYTAQECKNRGFADDKVYVVENGVDPELADIPVYLNGTGTKIKQHLKINKFKDKKIIVSLGRMTRRKGFTWFLENVVPQLDDDTVFILIGPNPDKQQALWKKVLPSKITNDLELAFGAVDESHTLYDLLEKNNIKDKVYLAGQLPFKDVMSLLSMADLFVMPNISVEGDAEGFGLVALEASVRGTTVLASGIEGITSAIKHNENGILLPSNDASAWVNCIKEQLQDPDKLSFQSENFRDYTLENYTWERMAEGYVKVFKQILGIEETQKESALNLSI